MNLVRNTFLLVVVMAAVTLFIGCAHVISQGITVVIFLNLSALLCLGAATFRKGRR